MTSDGVRLQPPMLNPGILPKLVFAAFRLGTGG
jgi:hypothetical protein